MITRNLHQHKDGDTTIVATLDDMRRVCIGETRDPEYAAEGRIDQMRIVMSLQDAVAFANAVLVAAEDAHYDHQWQMRLDYAALVDDCIEADYQFLRCLA